MAKSNGHRKEVNMEFGGPIGTFFIMTGLPIVVYSLYFYCNENHCGLPVVSLPEWRWQSDNVKLFSWEAMAVVIGWMIFQAVLTVVLPGRIKLGCETPDGVRLPYKLNGFPVFLVSTTSVIFACASGLFSPTYLYDHYVELLTASVIFSTGLAVYLYVISMFNRTTNLSPGGNTGNLIYDFFIGRQLNPRIGDFDWKYFCELRPGMTAWFLINLSCAAKMYQRTGTLSWAMILVQLGEGLYISDATAKEEAILSTVDIIHDGFGWMLSFGDLVFVPFTFSTQARYLVNYDNPITFVHFLGLAAVSFTGYYIFRMSNWEKHLFRTNPSDPRVKHLQTIETSTGSKLLVSGWWGMARHINYLGDWVQSFAWCLACGFNHVIPYFYSVYFATLLIHRELRDEHKCAEKYGEAWKKYCSVVKYRIVPYIY